MKKFYEFLQKEGDNAKEVCVNTQMANNAETDFLANFSKFREKNICYYNKEDDKERLEVNEKIGMFQACFTWEIGTDKNKNPIFKTHTFKKEYSTMLTEFKEECYNNYLIREAINKNFNKDIIPLTANEINEALFNLLYCAMPEKVATSSYNLLKWIKQTKNNLKLDPTLFGNRFLLQYSSRDLNDDTSKGGSGKTYILESISYWLSKYIGDFIKHGQGMFPTNNFIDTMYSKNLFIVDDEMSSLRDINFPAMKSLLTGNYYKAEEKGKMGILLRNIGNYIGASNQNFKNAKDKSLCDRIYEIVCDSKLNLRDEELFEQAKSQLPSREAIGNSFMYLLNLKDEVLDKIIEKYKEKKIIEQNSPGFNKDKLFLVVLIGDFFEKNNLFDTVHQIRPRKICDWINENKKTNYKIRQVIDTLQYMKDFINLDVKAPGNAEKKLYSQWSFKLSNKDFDNITFENDDISCIEQNRIFFGLSNKPAKFEEI